MGVVKGNYHYKITAVGKEVVGKPFGEAAADLPECKAADMAALEVEIYKVVEEKCQKKDFKFINSQVTPKVSLWTASIDMAYGA
eukprot:CAMPEP_0119062168 /NCGR_PEP_ID=MMETSP1178-20130426/5820_1 /TAXON_ID=33656 /ORGANISM="unid sp, Strain CCMP2000" /LENGTH=83 /DNA_ID=CAMNT_0007043433 /DNA_START=38 /DNA_END=289 /DNA_ORIENTATION=-